MKLVIHTQIRENYGAHTWDGSGECPQYWKFKGGNTIVVSGVTSANCGGLRVRMSDIICESNEYFHEYVIGGGFYLDSEECLDGIEEWELEYVREFKMKGKTIIEIDKHYSN